MKAKELIDYLILLGFSVYPDPHHMPEVPESMLPCLFVFGSGGFGSDNDLPIRFPSFQIVVKGKNAKTKPSEMSITEDLAMSLINALDQRTNYTIGGNTVYYSRSQQSSPIPLGLDINDHPIFSTNFNFKLQTALKGAN